MSEVDLFKDFVVAADDSTPLFYPEKYSMKGKEFQLDLYSLEFPLFSTANKDMQIRKYEIDAGRGQKPYKMLITPSSEGIANMFDKDVWVYLISKMMQARNAGHTIAKRVVFNLYDFLKTLGKNHSGASYERIRKSLIRLSGTNIVCDIDFGEGRTSSVFKPIDHFFLRESKDKSQPIYIEVEIPEMIYRNVVRGKKNVNEVTGEVKFIPQVLNLSPLYFSMTSPVKKRMYEISRKFCGRNASTEIGLKKLHSKFGSSMTYSRFKHTIVMICQDDDIPDYFLEFDNTREVLLISSRQVSYQRMEITYAQLMGMAHEGESRRAVWDRVLSERGDDGRLKYKVNMATKADYMNKLREEQEEAKQQEALNQQQKEQSKLDSLPEINGVALPESDIPEQSLLELVRGFI